MLRYALLTLCCVMLRYAELCCAMPRCYAMLRYALLCYAMLRYVALCCAMLRYAELCYATPPTSAKLNHATFAKLYHPRHAMPRNATPRHPSPLSYATQKPRYATPRHPHPPRHAALRYASTARSPSTRRTARSGALRYDRERKYSLSGKHDVTRGTIGISLQVNESVYVNDGDYVSESDYLC